MRFRMFPKLSTALPSGVVATEGTWIALEKIHGAQLVVGLDGDGKVLVGKRKSWLADGDAFFGWQLLRLTLARAALAIRSSLARQGTITREDDLVLYGELFGGGYPHADVPVVAALNAVQTGIWYAPNLHYALFAILVAPPDADDGILVGMADTLRAAEDAGLFAPPIVGRGSRADMLQLPDRYPSRVASALGLPPIANNLAEGFVARQDRRTRLSEVVAFKRKIDEMREVDFDQSVAFSPLRVLSTADLLALLPTVVNRARVESAGSKTGYENEEALLDELELDVRIDLEAALPMTMQSLDLAADRFLAEVIRGRAGEILRMR